MKQEIDTLIIGTETRFYYHGGRGGAVPPPPPDDKATRVLNNCHSLQCGGGVTSLFLFGGDTLFSVEIQMYNDVY